MIVGVFGVPVQLLTRFQEKIGTGNGFHMVFLPRRLTSGGGALEHSARYSECCLETFIRFLDQKKGTERAKIGIVAVGEDVAMELLSIASPCVPVSTVPFDLSSFHRAINSGTHAALGRLVNDLVGETRGELLKLQVYTTKIVDYVRKDTESTLSLPLVNFGDADLSAQLLRLCTVPADMKLSSDAEREEFEDFLCRQAEGIISAYCGSTARSAGIFYKRRSKGRIKGHFVRVRDGLTFVTPGDDLHGGPKENDVTHHDDGAYLGPMKAKGHRDRCRLSIAYRFGRRLATGYHFDCQFLPNRSIRESFILCHGSEVKVTADNYVNIYPNDYVREADLSLAAQKP